VKKTISIILILCFVFYIVGCSSNKFVDLEEPPAGESVKINLIDGTSKLGVLLQKSGTNLKYIDTETSKPEDLELTRIKSIERISTVYDLTGKPISENDISNAKGSGKTWGYGVGGFLAGGLIGFGAGALYSGVSDQSVALIYPIVGFGIAGAVFLGMKGSDQSRDDAIDDIRKKRYEATQKEMQSELKKQEQELKKRQKEIKDLKEKKKSGN
jgi:hypothetical protein